MSHRVPSPPTRQRTGKLLTERGRLIEAILKIHNQGRQRRPGPEARGPEGSFRLDSHLPRDGATGA